MKTMKTNLKLDFERRNKQLQSKALAWIIDTIKRYCIKYGWEFSTAYTIWIKNKHGVELDTDKNYLAQLVFWYEDNFKLFPSIIVKPDGTILS